MARGGHPAMSASFRLSEMKQDDRYDNPAYRTAAALLPALRLSRHGLRWRRTHVNRWAVNLAASGRVPSWTVPSGRLDRIRSCLPHGSSFHPAKHGPRSPQKKTARHLTGRLLFHWLLLAGRRPSCRSVRILSNSANSRSRASGRRERPNRLCYACRSERYSGSGSSRADCIEPASSLARSA